MAIKKFEVIAIRTDVYEIELDDEVFTEEWHQAFKSVFFDLDGLQGIAENLAFNQLRFGSGHRFIEGYGPVLRNGELPFSWNDFDAEGKLLPEENMEKAAAGINIIIKSEDDDYDIEIEEITE